MLTPRPRHPRTVSTSRRLRSNATEAEKRLWRAIRDDALGVRFRRQHPIGAYIADFACVEAKIVIEVDGGQHGGPEDLVRDAELNARGWLVLHYWNNEVIEKLDGVVSDIVRVLKERLGSGFPPP